MFKVNDTVINAAVKDWGVGKITKISGNTAEIIFPKVGSKKLSLIHANLKLENIFEKPELSEERPFINFSTKDLSNFANQYWDDYEYLQKIVQELPYRKRKPALDLRLEIATRLIELSLEFFLWPKTDVKPSANNLDNTDEWPKQGVLGFMGYKVGEQGIAEASRRDILDFVYKRKLPNLESPEYMKTWGISESSQRLKKIADSIASFAKCAKKKDSRCLKVAISEWEADLNYLHYSYYPKYSFEWPNTAV